MTISLVLRSVYDLTIYVLKYATATFGNSSQPPVARDGPEAAVGQTDVRENQLDEHPMVVVSLDQEVF
jgi:hypothetical protein